MAVRATESGAIVAAGPVLGLGVAETALGGPRGRGLAGRAIVANTGVGSVRELVSRATAAAGRATAAAGRAAAVEAGGGRQLHLNRRSTELYWGWLAGLAGRVAPPALLTGRHAATNARNGSP